MTAGRSFEKSQQDTSHGQALVASEGLDETTDKTTFTNHGAKPPVHTKAGARRPTASELAYGNRSKRNAPSQEEWDEAQVALQIAADIVQHGRMKMISDAPRTYTQTLVTLHAAVSGHSNGMDLPGSTRLELLESAQRDLQPAIELYERSEDGRTWLNDQLLGRLAGLRKDIRFAEARDRVNNSVLIGQDKVAELPDDEHPREQGQLLHIELQKLIPTIGQLNEQVVRMNHDGIHHEAESMMEGGGHGHGKKFGAGTLAELQNVLMIVDGFLTLNDEEFQHHLTHVQGILNGVATYSELVKAVTEMTGGAIGITASYASVIAKLSGDSALAASASGLARSSSMFFGNVIAGVEVVHGLFVMLDPHATAQEKVDAAVGASSGAAWLIGSKTAGAAVGFAASSAILIGYAELKYAVRMYWEASLGLTAGFMRLAYETIQRDGDAIARTADALTKTSLLLREEKDPERIEALKTLETQLAVRLGETVDDFIADSGPHGFEAGVAQYPGAYTILREAFAPVAKFRGAKTPEAAGAAARFALDKITWSIANASEIIVASTRQQHLADMDKDLAKKHEHGGEE